MAERGDPVLAWHLTSVPEAETARDGDEVAEN